MNSFGCTGPTGKIMMLAYLFKTAQLALNRLSEKNAFDNYLTKVGKSISTRPEVFPAFG